MTRLDEIAERVQLKGLFTFDDFTWLVAEVRSLQQQHGLDQERIRILTIDVEALIHGQMTVDAEMDRVRGQFAEAQQQIAALKTSV